MTIPLMKENVLREGLQPGDTQLDVITNVFPIRTSVSIDLFCDNINVIHFSQKELINTILNSSRFMMMVKTLVSNNLLSLSVPNHDFLITMFENIVNYIEGSWTSLFQNILIILMLIKTCFALIMQRLCSPFESFLLNQKHHWNSMSKKHKQQSEVTIEFWSLLQLLLAMFLTFVTSFHHMVKKRKTAIWALLDLWNSQRPILLRKRLLSMSCMKAKTPFTCTQKMQVDYLYFDFV